MLHLQGLPGPFPKMAIIWAADFDFYVLFYERSVLPIQAIKTYLLSVLGTRLWSWNSPSHVQEWEWGWGVGLASLKSENC